VTTVVFYQLVHVSNVGSQMTHRLLHRSANVMSQWWINVKTYSPCGTKATAVYNIVRNYLTLLMNKIKIIIIWSLNCTEIGWLYFFRRSLCVRHI